MAPVNEGNSLDPSSLEFAKLLTSEDELGSVLRAQLVIEYLADEILKCSVPNPDGLAALQLDFAGRIQLLRVLGFEEGLIKPLLNVGNLRNSFAHRLNYKLTSDRMRALYDCFNGTGKQTVQLAYDDTRKLRSQKKHPKSIWNLAPKDQFSLFAAAIRAMLLVALKLAKKGQGGEPHPMETGRRVTTTS
jgi:hypothetical protein